MGLGHSGAQSGGSRKPGTEERLQVPPVGPSGRGRGAPHPELGDTPEVGRQTGESLRG